MDWRRDFCAGDIVTSIHSEDFGCCPDDRELRFKDCKVISEFPAVGPGSLPATITGYIVEVGEQRAIISPTHMRRSDETIEESYTRRGYVNKYLKDQIVMIKHGTDIIMGVVKDVIKYPFGVYNYNVQHISSLVYDHKTYGIKCVPLGEFHEYPEDLLSSYMLPNQATVIAGEVPDILKSYHHDEEQGVSPVDVTQIMEKYELTDVALDRAASKSAEMFVEKCSDQIVTKLSNELNMACKYGDNGFVDNMLDRIAENLVDIIDDPNSKFGDTLRELIVNTLNKSIDNYIQNLINTSADVRLEKQLGLIIAKSLADMSAKLTKDS